MTNEMRDDLPPGIPDRMARLPISDRGFPVPWFVQWLEAQGSDQVAPVGEGYPEFRIMRAEARAEAITHKRCWVCGEKLGRYKAFVAGPMCAINRTSAEPPCHRDCAEWSARACPFLAKPKMVRREAGMPDASNRFEDMPGEGLTRNPGVALVWVCEDYRVFPDGKGSYLVEMGEPTEVRWFAERREATREEILESIDSGMPSLEAMIEKEPEDQREAASEELAKRRSSVVDGLVPA